MQLAATLEAPYAPSATSAGATTGFEVVLCATSRDGRWVLMENAEGNLQLPSRHALDGQSPRTVLGELCAAVGLGAHAARPVAAREVLGTLCEVVYGFRARPVICAEGFSWVPVRMVPWAHDAARVRSYRSLLAA